MTATAMLANHSDNRKNCYTMMLIKIHVCLLKIKGQIKGCAGNDNETIHDKISDSNDAIDNLFNK